MTVCPAWSVETAERRFLRLRGCFPAALVVGFHGSDGLWVHDFSRSDAIGTSLLSLAVI